MTLKPGIHTDIPAEVYHADPCPEPSLSAGIARRLISRSPLHAFTTHPRLNPDYEERPASGNMDFGSAAHSLLLEGMDICEVIDADDWRTKAAKEARDAARASGLVPLLRKDWERMCEFAEAVRAQTAKVDAHPRPLTDGSPEQTLIWQEGSAWCRARIDWLHHGEDAIDDLKCSGTTANPFVWARRRLFEDGYDIQCAFYRRGLKTLTGDDAAWRFVVAELDPPYALSVIGLSSAALELAERKVDRALELWKRCMDSGSWPGYPQEVALAEPPPWEEARYLEQHYEAEEVAA